MFGHIKASSTEKNTVISSDFLVWKFCGKTQFPHSFGQLARYYAETVPFRKISTPGNQVKLRYFLQCNRVSEIKIFEKMISDFWEKLGV